MAMVTIIIAVASCEEDFTTIETSVIGQNINVTLDESKSIIAYSRQLLPVQTNDLTAYQLGVYSDPVYGESSANYLGQVTLATPEPTFGENPKLHSAVLFVPFFNSSITDADGDATFELDSVFGNSPIKISVFESNFFLRDLDPESNFEDQQNYFSSQGSTFENNLILGGESPLTTVLNDFVPSDERTEILAPYDSLTNDPMDPIKVAFDTITRDPGLVIELPVEFFEKKIFDLEGEPELLNDNNFVDHFRGVYLQVENTNGGDNLFIFNAAEANISLRYTNEVTSTNDDDEEEINTQLNTLELDFDGINVNTFENNIPSEIQQALQSPNIAEGEETLYVRGGQGAVTILELFGDDVNGNGIADELEELRDKEWLINDATLTFYVDQSKVTGGEAEPERIKIFNARTGNILVDYSFDATSNNSAFEAVTTHLGPLERGSDELGDFYRIRITNHLSDLINNDSINAPLGLVVSQNVLLTDFQDLENNIAPGLKTIPASTIMARQGTVLHGNASTDEARRLKLQIYYTEPK